MTISPDPIYRLPPWRCEATYRPTELAEVVDWSLAAYNVPAQWKTTMGQGIKVAVLDTGIDAQHPDLAAAIDALQDFTGSSAGTNDMQGHGTHTAGTIAARRNGRGVVGVAPECRLLIGKVLGDDGSGSDVSVAAGLQWAIATGADVISMSLGSAVPSSKIQAAIVAAAAAGKFIICAAGNDGQHGNDDTVGYPARWRETIAVGAVDSQGQVADFSSRGPEVDIAAPGVNILSTFLNGGYARLSGMSMATPFVSGVVALMLSKHRALTNGATPLMNVADLRVRLQNSADPVGTGGQNDSYGWGLIDPARMLAAEDPPSPPPATPQPPPANVSTQPRVTVPATLLLDGNTIAGTWVFLPHA